MSQQSQDDRAKADRPTRVFLTARQFACAVIAIAVILNAILLLSSVTDVYPRGRPGVHNFKAMLIGLIYSPVANVMLACINLSLASFTRSRVLRESDVRVALLAPLAGAAVNLITVFLIVPWSGPGIGHGAH